MLEITSSEVLNGRAILYVLAGCFDPGQMAAVVRNRYTDPSYDAIRAYLWDVRLLGLPETPAFRESTRDVASARSEHADRRPVFIIVDRLGSTQFGVARMWQNTFDFPMEIHDSVEAALAAAEKALAAG